VFIIAKIIVHTYFMIRETGRCEMEQCIPCFLSGIRLGINTAGVPNISSF